jgi:hypothetical protein
VCVCVCVCVWCELCPSICSRSKHQPTPKCLNLVHLVAGRFSVSQSRRLLLGFEHAMTIPLDVRVSDRIVCPQLVELVTRGFSAGQRQVNAGNSGSPGKEVRVPSVPWSPLRICLQWSCWLTPIAKSKGSLSVMCVLTLINGYILRGEALWTAAWQRGDRS